MSREVRLIDANALSEKVSKYISVAGKNKILGMIEEEPTPWISVKDQLPTDERVIVIVNGEYKNITFIDAVETAEYFAEEKEWILDCYPYVKGVRISYWMPMPEPPTLRDGDNYKVIGKAKPIEGLGGADEVHT